MGDTNDMWANLVSESKKLPYLELLFSSIENRLRVRNRPGFIS